MPRFAVVLAALLLSTGVANDLTIVDRDRGQQLPRFPDSVALNPELISLALEEARTGQIRPYRLYKGGHRSADAAVYTPFIRVALAAQLAFRRENAELDPADLPTWITEPVVWVVFPPPCLPGCPPAFIHDDDHRRLGVVGISEDMSNRAMPVARPIRVLQDMTQFARLGVLPFADASVAAAFQPLLFRSGWTVFALWTFSDSRGSYLGGAYSSGLIASADLATWR
jgi:hypothetical protein